MDTQEIEAHASDLNDHVFSFTHDGATEEYFDEKEITDKDERLMIMDESILILTDAAKKANK